MSDLWKDIKDDSSAGALCFSVHSDLAGKADHKHHRNVSRKQSGVITSVSGLRGRRGRALKGFF